MDEYPQTQFAEDGLAMRGGLIAQASALLPSVQTELARAKMARNELREELHAAEQEVSRLRSLELSLTATVNGLDAPPENGGLIGWRVGEAAVRVLRQGDGPMHYKDIWRQMYETGDRIDSDEPESVVLTALTRHPDVTRTGRGIYGLTAEAEYDRRMTCADCGQYGDGCMCAGSEDV